MSLNLEGNKESNYAAFLFILSVLLLMFPLLFLAPPASASDPFNLQITNIRDTSFTVSWTTAVPEPGNVVLTDGAVFNDDRGPAFSGLVHYVTLNGLQPTRAYSFDIMSGGTKYDNGNAHWTVTTSATLSPPTPDFIVGQVKNADASIVLDAIVLFTIQHGANVSAPLSMLITPRDGGFFHINLSDARGLNDPNSYFTYAKPGDLLAIQVLGPNGIGVLNIDVGDPRLRAADPKQTVIIDLKRSIELPTVVAQPLAPPPPPSIETSVTDSGILLIGIAIAAFVMAGVVGVAMFFVWRR